MTRWIILLVIVLALVGGAGYWGFRSARPPAPSVPQAPPTVAVTRGDVQQTVTGPGVLVCTRESLLEMQVGGRLAEVNVRAGDSVKKGDVLARLDTWALENAVREATAKLEQSRFKLQKAKRDAESGTDLAAAWKNVEAARLGVINAQGNYSSTLLRADVTGDVQMAKFWADYWADDLGDKWLALRDNPNSDSKRIQYEEAGARSANAHNRMLQITQDAQNQLSSARRGLALAQQNYLSALSSYNSLKNGDPVKQAELQVLLNETALTRAQLDLTNAELKAPWNAMIATVDIAPGSQVSGAPAMAMVDIGHLQFVTNNLSERDLGRVAVGQKVNITLKAFPDAKLTGTVASIAPLAGQLVGDAATFAVRIDLDATDLTLRPGMTGQVQIVVK